MGAIYTSAELASLLGRNVSTICRHAQRLGLSRRIGGARVYTVSERTLIEASLAEAEARQAAGTRETRNPWGRAGKPDISRRKSLSGKD